MRIGRLDEQFALPQVILFHILGAAGIALKLSYGPLKEKRHLLSLDQGAIEVSYPGLAVGIVVCFQRPTLKKIPHHPNQVLGPGVGQPVNGAGAGPEEVNDLQREVV